MTVTVIHGVSQIHGVTPAHGVTNIHGVTQVGSALVSYAGTVIDDNTVGTIAWTNAFLAQGNQSLMFATWAAGGTNVTSHYLNAQNYGFNVPSGATILGISLGIYRRAPLSTLRDSTVSLIKGGIVSGNNKASATNWLTTFMIANYGGPTDLWGLSWTPADINAANFGAVLSVFGTSKLSSALVAWLKITVYYK